MQGVRTVADSHTGSAHGNHDEDEPQAQRARAARRSFAQRGEGRLIGRGSGRSRG